MGPGRVEYWPETILAAIGDLPFTDEDREKINSGNAKRLARPDAWATRHGGEVDPTAPGPHRTDIYYTNQFLADASQALR